MSTCTGSGHDDTLRATDEDFLNLICADEEFLRAEFDAIIAVGWPQTPQPPRGHRICGGGRGERQPRQVDPDASVRLVDSALNGDAWSRQRSPPLRKWSVREQRKR